MKLLLGRLVTLIIFLTRHAGGGGLDIRMPCVRASRKRVCGGAAMRASQWCVCGLLRASRKRVCRGCWHACEPVVCVWAAAHEAAASLVGCCGCGWSWSCAVLRGKGLCVLRGVGHCAAAKRGPRSGTFCLSWGLWLSPPARPCLIVGLLMWPPRGRCEADGARLRRQLRRPRGEACVHSSSGGADSGAPTTPRPPLPTAAGTHTPWSPQLGQPPGVRLRSVCGGGGGWGGGGVCVWGDLVWQQRGDSGIHHNRWGVGWKFDLLGSLDGPSWRTKHYDKLAAFYCSLLKFALATQLYNQFLFSKNPKLGVLKYHVPPHDLSLSQSGRISMAHRARALVQRRRAPVQTNHGPPPRWRPRTPTCEQPRTRPRSSDASIPG